MNRSESHYVKILKVKELGIPKIIAICSAVTPDEILVSGRKVRYASNCSLAAHARLSGWPSIYQLCRPTFSNYQIKFST